MKDAPERLEPPTPPPKTRRTPYQKRILALLEEPAQLISLYREVAVAKLALEDAVMLVSELQEECGEIPASASDALLEVAERVAALVERAAKVEALKVQAAGGTHEQQVIRQMLLKQLLDSLRQVAPNAVPLIESKWRLLAGNDIPMSAESALPQMPTEIEVHLRPITRSEDGGGVVSLAATTKLPTPLDEEERQLAQELGALRKLQDARRAVGNGNGNGNGNGHADKEAV
jgi:hypothetical protein